MSQQSGSQPAGRLSIENYVAECFVKCGGVILASRLHKPVRPAADKRSARWFHLDYEEIQTPGMEVEQWRRGIADPMVLEFYLHTPGGTAPGSAPAPSGSAASSAAPLELLLERWTLAFRRADGAAAPPGGSHANGLRGGSDELAVYKRMILLLRCLYSRLRALPAYKICRTVQTGDLATPFRVSYRVLRGTAGLREASNRAVFAHSRTKALHFAPVEAGVGSFHVGVEYETAVRMHVPEQTATASPAPAVILDSYIGGPSPSFPFAHAPAPLAGKLPQSASDCDFVCLQERARKGRGQWLVVGAQCFGGLGVGAVP